MSWTVWIASAWLITAPGIVLGKLLRVRGPDVLVSLALRMGLGLSFWPLLTLWTSTAGFHWSVKTARLFIVLVTIAAGFSVIIDRAELHRLFRSVRASSAWVVGVGVLTIATVWTRWIQARNLAFPPWGDAVHHAMIIRLIIAHGSVPRSLSPFVEGGDLYYHWGFHALAAWTAWMTGDYHSLDIPALLLNLGQLLNSLTLLTVYAGARLLLRSRWAALIAGGLATLVSYFPAYYLSWGRYTQLTGVLLLPVFLVALWRIGLVRKWRGVAATAILASGLALIHVRIAFLAAIFALELAAILVFRGRWRQVAAWLVAGLAAFALACPWLLYIARDPYVHSFITADTANVSTRVVERDLLWVPHNRELLAIATCGVSGIGGWLGMPLAGRLASGVWWCICLLLTRRRTATVRLWPALAILGSFCAVVALLLGYRGWGLDFTRFASVSSAITSLFLPLAIASAGVVLWVAQQTLGLSKTGAVGIALTGGIVLSAMLFLRTVVNPATILADQNDARALAWIREHVPAGSRFAVSARVWMDDAWIGSDGGYWIGVATDCRSTVPPLLYAWSLPPERVAGINDLIYVSNRADCLSTPAMLRQLHRAGVTYFYVGSRADPARLSELLRSGQVKVIHREGTATVLRVL